MFNRILAAASMAALSLVAVAPIAAGANTALVPDDERFFVRQGGDCGAADNPFLSTRPGSGESNCGYIGGGPFGEIFTQAGLEANRVYSTTDGVPVVLDGDGTATGTIVVGSYAGAGGAGQVIVDVALTVNTGGFSSTTIGSESIELTVTPIDDTVAADFAFDLDDSLHGLTASDVSLDVTVRGAFVAHGFTQANGESFVTMPILVEDDAS